MKYDYKRLYQQEVDTPFARTRAVAKTFFREGSPDINKFYTYTNTKWTTEWLTVSDRERRRQNYTESLDALRNTPLYDISSDEDTTRKLYGAVLRRLDRIMSIVEGKTRREAITLGKKLVEFQDICLEGVSGKNKN
jgi:Tfp pilus assembly protein FimT